MRIRNATFFLILSPLLLPTGAQADYDIDPPTRKVIEGLIQAVKNKDKEAVAGYIRYPLEREQPIPDIDNKADLVNRYDEVFDEALISEIANSTIDKDWSPVGWRGVMLGNGSVWVDYGGPVIAINHISAAEEALKQKLIAAMQHTLHPSLATFKKPELEWKTAKFRIRIDEMADNTYRYAVWPVAKAIGEKPDLILMNGKVVFEGSGGNLHYEFKNGAYTYQCHVVHISEGKSPPGYLLVFKNDKEILSQDVVEVVR